MQIEETKKNDVIRILKDEIKPFLLKNMCDCPNRNSFNNQINSKIDSIINIITNNSYEYKKNSDNFQNEKIFYLEEINQVKLENFTLQSQISSLQNHIKKLEFEKEKDSKDFLSIIESKNLKILILEKENKEFKKKELNILESAILSDKLHNERVITSISPNKNSIFLSPKISDSAEGSLDKISQTKRYKSEILDQNYIDKLADFAREFHQNEQFAKELQGNSSPNIFHKLLESEVLIKKNETEQKIELPHSIECLIPAFKNNLENIIETQKNNFEKQKIDSLRMELNKIATNLNVTKKLSLTEYEEEYKCEITRKTIQELKLKMPYYRKIRGDGNCFYRAVGYLWLEKLIEDDDGTEDCELAKYLRLLTNEENKFSLLKCISSEKIDIINECLKNQDILLDNFQNKLFKYFRLKRSYLNKKMSNSTELIKTELENDINDDGLFDMSLIVFMRTITYQKAEEKLKEEEFSSFVPDQKELLNSFSQYGLEAENSVILLNAEALGIKIDVNMLYTERGGISTEKKVTINVITFEGSQGNHNKIAFTLFFRPGHYDIGYCSK